MTDGDGDGYGDPLPNEELRLEQTVMTVMLIPIRAFLRSMTQRRRV